MKRKAPVQVLTPKREEMPIAPLVEQCWRCWAKIRREVRRTQGAWKGAALLTSGYRTDLAKTVNGALFSVKYDEMVIVKDIEFFSMCEHHLLPFFGKIHVAYLPKDRVIGTEQDPAHRGRLRAPPADSGAADAGDRAKYPGYGGSAGRGRDL